jgi:transcriptional regulator with PAS, ATPase and Fis domain
MSPGSSLALVADDQRLASALQSHLQKNLGRQAFLCKYEAVRLHLGRHTNGLLLLAVASPAEAEQALRLVQDIYIQKFPPGIILLEAEQLPRLKELTRLDPYVTRRLRWPEEAAQLPPLAKERTEHAQPFLGTYDESLEEIISNRLLAQTPSLLPMVECIALASAHDVTVLLTGETGTGKTYLARLMHDCSPRKHHPFLCVPCGAQPANLVESAFFGHIKGAFTGADRAKEGKFAAAGHGSILLDEIDTLGLEQQAGLLRVIETGEYEPVGSNDTRRCHARIIVASNWDLEEAVQRGRFRQDLYYRLNVMSFHLPPLRERVQDIAPLVRGFAARFNTKFRKDLFDISPEAMTVLELFPWPGNIRQLENVVQQAVLVSSGPELLLEHLPQPVRDGLPNVNGNGPPHTALDSLAVNRNLLEKNVIKRALANHGNSRAKAALALGISRVTLYKKMKKHGLMPQQLRGNRG